MGPTHRGAAEPLPACLQAWPSAVGGGAGPGSGPGAAFVFEVSLIGKFLSETPLGKKHVFKMGLLWFWSHINNN